MSNQQKFQPGDRVKVTMDLTIRDEGVTGVTEGTIADWTLDRWDNQDHINIELIERPEPPLEPGLYLCNLSVGARALRWDGKKWRWLAADVPISAQDEVTVIGTITLNDGVEL